MGFIALDQHYDITIIILIDVRGIGVAVRVLSGKCFIPCVNGIAKLICVLIGIVEEQRIGPKPVSRPALVMGSRHLGDTIRVVGDFRELGKLQRKRAGGFIITVYLLRFTGNRRGDI